MYKGYDGERVQVASYSPPSVQTLNAPHNVSGGNLLGVWHHDDRARTPTSNCRAITTAHPGLVRSSTKSAIPLDIDFLYHLNWRGRQDLLLGAGGRWSPDNITQKFATLGLPATAGDRQHLQLVPTGSDITIVPKKLVLTLGSKFEHNNYSGFEIQPDGRLTLDTDRTSIPLGRGYASSSHSLASRSGSAADRLLAATSSVFPSSCRKQKL